jgi:hypothetical protein
MQTIENTVVETVRAMTLKDLTVLVLQLQEEIKTLKNPPTPTKSEGTEMTYDHARRIMNGDLKDKKHKEAAAELGLTYGQVYSCRIEATFKTVHKELKDSGFKNPWVK